MMQFVQAPYAINSAAFSVVTSNMLVLRVSHQESADKGRQQRIIVIRGYESGFLEAFTAMNGIMKPFWAKNFHRRVSHLAIFQGTQGVDSENELVIAVTGSIIVLLSAKNGDLIFQFDTCLMTSVLYFDVNTSGLHLANHQMYISFNSQGTEQNSLAIGDINCLASISPTMVAVGCMDNKILLLENCKIISTIVTKSPCSALCYALSDKPEIHLICGTHLGTIQGFSLLNGIVSEQFTIHSNTALSNQMGVQTLSSITHLVYYSDSTGIKLVSACVDGMVQIHSIQLEGDNQSSPKLLSKKNINIFVQSMAVNIYGGALNIPEIMIGERHGGMTALIPLIGSISDLQLALSNLKEDLETCQKGSQHKVTTQTFHGEELNIDVQLNFQPLAGCAILSVNSQDFIYMISCHSSAPIIIGCTEHNESKKGPNSIHLSGLSNLSNLHTSFSVCMQDDTKKCILQLNLLEGRAARLCISVLPMAPNRQCIKQWIDIKPLCHHGRISSLDLERSSMHQLKVSSNMSMLSLHYWVSLLFPGVNEQVQTVSPKIHYYFISEAWGSAVICTIEKGCLQFATNDAITLQFLRENLLALNQAHQSKVDIVSHLNLPVCLDEQIQHLFSTIKAFADAAKNALIHEGLKELEALEGSEGVAACLDEEMKQIWQCNNGKQLQELKKSVDAAISRLETLYISSFELRGMAVGGNCEQFSRQLREAVHIMEERGHNPLSFDIVRHFFYSNSP